MNFLSTFPVWLACLKLFDSLFLADLRRQALFLVDRVGRTTLLCFSATGMALCCATLALVGDACFSSSGSVPAPKYY